jgi:7,8-dihydropterin-6-yl-methyl-4-(beta-D-ribofuranosyl)aminobenzene 5'-phosphate synthase
MKITVLVDNTGSRSAPELVGEHGLSLLVETAHAMVLFDSGASDLVMRNARALGVDLGSVDAFVLSHGHYDHGGGLAAFLGMNRRAKVYMGPGALDIHVARFGIVSKKVGLDGRALEPFRDRFSFMDEPAEIGDGIFVVPRIAAMNPTPRDSGMFYSRTGAGVVPDDFSHEMLLAVKADAGMAVLTGCSHRGVLNIVAAAEARFPRTDIAAVIGGLHMTNPATRRLGESRDVIASIAATLRDDPRVKRLYTGHCTGDAAYAILKETLGEKLDALIVGKRIIL